MSKQDESKQENQQGKRRRTNYKDPQNLVKLYAAINAINISRANNNKAKLKRYAERYGVAESTLRENLALYNKRYQNTPGQAPPLLTLDSGAVSMLETGALALFQMPEYGTSKKGDDISSSSSSSSSSSFCSLSVNDQTPDAALPSQSETSAYTGTGFGQPPPSLVVSAFTQSFLSEFQDDGASLTLQLLQSPTPDAISTREGGADGRTKSFAFDDKYIDCSGCSSRNSSFSSFSSSTSSSSSSLSQIVCGHSLVPAVLCESSSKSVASDVASSTTTESSEDECTTKKRKTDKKTVKRVQFQLDLLCDTEGEEAGYFNLNDDNHFWSQNA